MAAMMHQRGNFLSIALTLKSSEAKEVLLHLVCWADIVVINFPPRLGLPYDALSPAILRAGLAPHRVTRETALSRVE
jgi:CoA-transferase family III